MYLKITFKSMQYKQDKNRKYLDVIRLIRLQNNIIKERKRLRRFN